MTFGEHIQAIVAIEPKELKLVFYAALFTVFKTWKQHKHSFIDERIKDAMYYIHTYAHMYMYTHTHTVEYCSALRTRECSHLK